MPHPFVPVLAFEEKSGDKGAEFAKYFRNTLFLNKNTPIFVEPQYS